MFDIGDYIVYGHNGICRVLDITHPDISGVDTDRLYYVLMPEKTKGSRLFCPADDDNISIRRVINEQEAKEIISASKGVEPLVIENDRMRDVSYKNAMKSSDLMQWIKVIKTLLIRKRERENLGKKITATDERYLKLAQEGLYSELALATGIRNSLWRQVLERKKSRR